MKECPQHNRPPQTSAGKVGSPESDENYVFRIAWDALVQTFFLSKGKCFFSPETFFFSWMKRVENVVAAGNENKTIPLPIRVRVCKL